MNVALPGWRLAAAHWPLLVACALFPLVAVLILDDYGISGDGENQRAIGSAALDYLAGEGERAFERLWFDHDRYYGPGWELLLVLVERVLGLEDSRDIWLSRHFLTHLFFLVSGAFCYLLVYRILGSRMLALVAMILFLLHPRLYAQSFINSKDLPFLAMFMIALYFTHRAFRRDTLGAFLLCGMSVGILVHLRIIGLVLLAAVLAMRALDMVLARDGRGRARVLLTGGGFTLAAILTYYAAMPFLWIDPVGQFAELWNTLSNHPNAAYNLFRGEWLYALDGPPFDYIPVWIGITTPLVVPLLALIGAVGLVWQGARRPRDLPRNTSLRFGLLLLFLFVAPLIYIPAAGNNVYHDWRQVSFLYAPLVLLAVAGLWGLLSLYGERRMRAGIWVLAGVGVAVMVVSMMRIHPVQASYFNALVDRTTPNRLMSQYLVGGWNQDYWGVLKSIVEDHPDQRIFVNNGYLVQQLVLLPASDRDRVSTIVDAIYNGEFYSTQPVSGRVYTSRIYNNLHIAITGVRIGTGGAAAIIKSAISGEPVRTFNRYGLTHRSFGSFWIHENAIIFVMDDCSDDYLDGHAILHLYPHDPSILFGETARDGFVQHWINITTRHRLEDGRCAVVFLLPDYPVVSVNAHHRRPYPPDPGKRALWDVWIGITPPVDEAVLEGEPEASSVFDVYRDDDALVYVKDGCTDEEAEVEFLVQLFPVDPGDLPAGVNKIAFDNSAAMLTAFRLWDMGGRYGDHCIARFPLPTWPVANVRTGQYDETGYRWQVRFAVTPPTVAAEVLAGEPLVSSAFDIHLDGDALVYVREGCTEEDAGHPFFLHLTPVDTADLPDEGKVHGFDNRDFGLWDHGARINGRCFAVVPLPEYPVASVRTGQYDATGEIWTAQFPLVRPDAAVASLSGEPAASSVYDIYLEGRTLTYVRDGCTEDDIVALFFIHAEPVDVADLPAPRREHGFANLDFSFAARGARTDGKCVAVIPLPAYPIASVRTGQYDATGELWSVEFALPDRE